MSCNYDSYDTKQLESIDCAVWQMKENQLTKRERFAMAAMQGIMADGNYLDSPEAASKAVEYADALIAELEKGKPCASE